MSSGAPIFDADLNPIAVELGWVKEVPNTTKDAVLPTAARKVNPMRHTNEQIKQVAARFEQLRLVGAVADDGVNSRAESFAGCVRCRPAYGQSWPFERMPDLVILPVHDLTAGQRPAKSRYWRDHGNLPEHGDDPESNRRRVRVPR